MAAYGTPQYNYEQSKSALTQGKTAQDAAASYGRFLGQERFRRNSEQANQGFRRQFPAVGQHFNQRGLWNSGLRRQGQQQFTQDFADTMGNAQFEQAGQEQQFQLDQNTRDAQYLMALQTLFENLQAGRASGYDPYAGVRPQVGA
jgi:hypothetical protein